MRRVRARPDERSLVLAAVLAVAALALGSARVGGNRFEYGEIARAIRAGEGFAAGGAPTAFVEPFFPLLLAATDASNATRVALQIAAMVGAGALVARMFRGPSPPGGNATTPSRSLSLPTLIAATVTLWPPAVLTALSPHANPHAFRMFLLAALVSSAHARHALLFGLALGACVWIRAAYLIPGLALALVAFPPRAAPRTLATAFAIAIAVASPWWVRNAITFGTFLPTTTNVGLNLATGNHPGARGDATTQAKLAAAEWARATVNAAPENERAAQRAYLRATVRYAKTHPWLFAEGVARKAAYLAITRPDAGKGRPIVLRLAYAAFALLTFPLILCGITAAPALPEGGRRDARIALLLPAALLFALFSLTVVDMRDRFELDVLLAPFVVLGALRVRATVPSLLARTRQRRRNVLHGAAAIAGSLLALGVGLVIAKPSIVTAPLIRADALVLSPRLDAVFVFSGDVDFHRTESAAALFHSTGAKWFVVSGAGSGGDNAALMASAAEAAGVPASAIVVEEHATTTRENARFTSPLLAERGITRVAVVTSPYHSRRAAMAAQRAWGSGVEVISVPAPLYRGETPKAEWPKLVRYALLGWI